MQTIFLLSALLLISLWAAYYLVASKRRTSVLLHAYMDYFRTRGTPEVDDGEQAVSGGTMIGRCIAPATLLDLYGTPVSLTVFRAQTVLLIHWDSDDADCRTLAPQIAALQTELHKGHVSLVLVARGTIDANRQLARDHGLSCPVLLADNANTVKEFIGLAAPAAYLLDKIGRITAMACGADEVMEMACGVIDNRGEHSIIRNTITDRIDSNELIAEASVSVLGLVDSY